MFLKFSYMKLAQSINPQPSFWDWEDCQTQSIPVSCTDLLPEEKR